MSTRAYYVPWGRSLDLSNGLTTAEYEQIIAWQYRIRGSDRPVFLCETSGASMFVRQHSSGRYHLVHFGSEDHDCKHVISPPKSDEHKRQQEYIFESATAAGLWAEPEYRTSGGTIVDVAVSGTGNVAVECQLSSQTTAKAVERTYATATSENFPSAPLWIDSAPVQTAPRYMRFVPSARGTVSEWQTMPVRGSARAVIGEMTPDGRTLKRIPKTVIWDDLIVARAESRVVAVEHPGGTVSLAIRGTWCDGVIAGDFPGFRPWNPRPSVQPRKESAQVWSRPCVHPPDKYERPPIRPSGMPDLPTCPRCGSRLFWSRDGLCGRCKEARDD